MSSYYWFSLALLVMSQQLIDAQEGCTIVASAAAGASGESVIQTATAEALATAIVNVQSGSACAEAAALAVAQVSANATAKAYVDALASVPEGCEGIASASGQSFANSTAAAIANATAVAFAQVLTIAEAQAVANAVSVDVQSAVAQAEASAASTGGVAQASSEAIATAVATATAEAYATALAQFNSDQCNGIDEEEQQEDQQENLNVDNVAQSPSGGGVINSLTSLITPNVEDCPVASMSCTIISLSGGATNCCDVDFENTEIGSQCEAQGPGFTKYTYKGVCLKEMRGNVGIYAAVLQRTVGFSIFLSDCVCRDSSYQYSP
eukprot:TRINITY_DN5603_c0_g1_i3.p2 TRINITY_DN5603_c0_g1~~TRINITY_DN5603_c0_g1_i3.p2  ORF type:complete len:368 (+),score=48.36 TRINITY_DN5603_c0_g1_i3:137-1105(+)